MLCPFCLEDVRFKKTRQSSKVSYACPVCNEHVPILYVQEYEQYPPVVVNAIGFRGHGKTVYFATLFYVLSKQRLGKHWNKFFTMCLNEESLDTVRMNVRMLEEGILPESTPKNFPRPTIVRLQNVPTYPDCTLLFYDTSGEAFEKASQLVQFASFVKRARTVVFLLSITELDDIPTKMRDLLNIYIIGIGDLGGQTHNQHLLVVYTKADKMESYLTEYPDLRDYLKQGTVDGLANMKGYIQRMRKVSDCLKEFTRNTLQAEEFLNAAQEYFKSVSFCIVSALGASPTENKLSVEITPKRVLDPLFWLMERSLPWWQRLWR
ncbi:MAG: hypothetical protein RMK18_11690 [Armatimonadota bacterium]|nr:GTPase domain-containing protein [Armatimonadota bacterium]MDW8026508.1 hypothetical protein [Armatimonadota bacterium]